MTVDVNSIIAVVAGAAILGGGVCALLSQMPFVKNRPGLANFIRGCENAAKRIALAVPPGATIQQVEAAIAAEAADVMQNYSQSAKASNATLANAKSEIAAALSDHLPAGHVVQPPAAPPIQTLGGNPPSKPMAPVLPVLPPAPAPLAQA